MQSVASKIEKIMELVLSLNEDLADRDARIRILEDKLSMFDTLKEINYYMGTELDLKNIIQIVTDVIIGVLGVSACVICLKNAESWDLREHSFLEKNKDFFLPDMIESFSDQLLNNNGEVLITDLSASNMLGLQKGALVALALTRGSNYYGYICTYYEHPDSLSGNKIEFFKLIIAQLGIHLENASLFEKIKLSSITDGLSGLFNRIHLNEILSHFGSFKLGGCSMVMIDIDKFKRINDTYGHLFGDQVIKALSKLLKAKEKKYNLTAFRYGGEEFLLLCSNYNHQELLKIAEEIRTEFASLEFITEDNRSISCTVSLGISRFYDSCIIDDPLPLIDIADKALYFSKKSGRNRSTFATGDLQLYLESLETIRRLIARYRRFQHSFIMLKITAVNKEITSKQTYLDYVNSISKPLLASGFVYINYAGDVICIFQDNINLEAMKELIKDIFSNEGYDKPSFETWIYNNEHTDIASFFNIPTNELHEEI